MKFIHNKNIIERITLAAFCTGSLIFYSFIYENHLILREQMQLFEFSREYLRAALLNNGGFADYSGEFLVQFFRIPFCGGIIITSLLTLLWYLTRLLITKFTGRACGLFSAFIPVSAYFVLFLNNYYPVSGLTGLLMSLICLIAALRNKEWLPRLLSGIFIIPIVYWIAGGAYIVFSSLFILFEILLLFRSKPYRYQLLVSPFLFAVLSLGMPVLIRGYLIENTLLQSFLSSAYFSLSSFFPLPIIMLFICFPILILAELIRKKLRKTFPFDLLTSFLVAMIFIAGFRSFANLKAEESIGYDNLVYKAKWDKIIKQAESRPPSDWSSIAAVNLALGSKGLLSEKFFKFDQDSASLFITYNRKGTTPFLASDIYFILGLYNFSQMFAMETIESSPDGKLPARSFKRMAETHMINGQYDIAMKYLKPLSHTIFYKKWSNHYIMAIFNGDEIEKDQWLIESRKKSLKQDFYYDPNQWDIALKSLLISDHENRIAYEYLMAFYLLSKDLDGFLTGLQLAEKFGYQTLPSAWQEASLYIRTRLNTIPPVLDKYETSSEVTLKMRNYISLFTGNRADSLQLKNEFGTTYWYYLHFR